MTLTITGCDPTGVPKVIIPVRIFKPDSESELNTTPPTVTEFSLNVGEPTMPQNGVRFEMTGKPRELKVAEEVPVPYLSTITAPVVGATQLNCVLLVTKVTVGQFKPPTVMTIPTVDVP